MKLPVLPPKKSLKGTRVFLRVDWNVPISGEFAGEDSLKLTRSLQTVSDLAARGAIVLVATHLGRPKKKEAALSTQHLLPLIGMQYHGPVTFIGEALDTKSGLVDAQKRVAAAGLGSVFLLENVRFYPGEEKNDKKLAKAFASLADLFVNDAFASCHRAHASVVGVASILPHFAGPSLVGEVAALEKLITKPKHPFFAFIGGAKISTKVDVITSLLKVADRVYIGGAMATTFFAAAKKEIGMSFVEKEGIAVAKKLLKEPKIVLPVDVLVAKKIAPGARPCAVSIDAVGKKEAIGDIGPATMRAWSADLKKAKTVAWNGPMGVTEIPAFSHGSLVLARAIATRSKGSCYGVIGGGDTLPVALASGMSEWYDWLSTGGGAMLEFIAESGKLPGLLALTKKK
jgi:phosphoglycerate kinase